MFFDYDDVIIGCESADVSRGSLISLCSRADRPARGWITGVQHPKGFEVDRSRSGSSETLLAAASIREDHPRTMRAIPRREITIARRENPGRGDRTYARLMMFFGLMEMFLPVRGIL